MDSGPYQVVLLFVCLVLSCFFSAAETALTSLSEAKTLQMLEEGGIARALKLWLHKPNRVLTTILIGNNVVNTLSAAIATVIAEDIFGNFAIGIATGVMTLLILVFGEVTPKTFARYNAVKLAPWMMYALMPAYWLLSPFVISLSWLVAGIVRLIGGNTTSGPTATHEDIDFIIRLGQQEGVLKKDEGELLESALDFRDTIVREVMVPRPQIASFEKSDSLDEVLAQIQEHGHSRWPVYDENIDNVIGILHSKDLFKVLAAKPAHFSLTDYVRPALFVPDTMKVSHLLKEFQHGRAHLAIVVDEYGSSVGVVSLEDVLEELVGEIRDEHDDAEHETLLKQLDDNTFWADGRASIYDVNEALQIEIPEDEPYESLGGFLTSLYGKVPPPKTEIEYHGWRFVVESADKKRIISIRMERITLFVADDETV